VTLLHVILLSVWGGLVLCETVLELAWRDRQALVAEAHFLIDLFVEIPVVLGVLATGAVLLARAWPPAPLLLVKVACALIAIAANLICAVLVMHRYRVRHDDAAAIRWGRWVRATGLGGPFALAALILGFVR
jgi:hypothetical protein